MNSNDPRVQRTMQFAQGAGRNTSYAHALYYPYGSDAGAAFKDLLHMSQRMNGAPEASIQVERETPLSPAPGSRCARLQGKSGKARRGRRQVLTALNFDIGTSMDSAGHGGPEISESHH